MSGTTPFLCWMELGPQETFAEAPEAQGVFLLRPTEPNAEPYLSHSTNLRRRLRRLLAPEQPASRLGNLGKQVAAVEFRQTASPFETRYWLYRAARELFPSRYRVMLRLRPPVLIKVGLDNEYPRCWVTRHISRSPGQYVGPFPSRAAAERFASDFLDLFRIRRCIGAIHPDPSFPGCIYSEMKMCLAPCFAGCTSVEYQREVERVTQFLSTQGQSLLAELERAREEASAQLRFEVAGQIHKKIEKVHPVLRSKEELARDLNHLHGVMVQASTEHQCVELFALRAGCFHFPMRFTLAPTANGAISLERRLKETFEALGPLQATGQERSEHLALLARWYFSSFRRGELILFLDWDRLPYRRIIRACSRVLSAEKSTASVPPPAS